IRRICSPGLEPPDRPPRTRGRPRRPSRIHARNGRAFSILTAVGGGLVKDLTSVQQIVAAVGAGRYISSKCPRDIVIRAPPPPSSPTVLPGRQPSLPTGLESPAVPGHTVSRAFAARRQTSRRREGEVPCAPRPVRAPPEHPGGHHEKAFPRRLGVPTTR